MKSPQQIAHEAVLNHGALQKPGELARLLMLVQPGDHVLEIGSDGGGSTWAFTQRGATVLSVSLPDGRFSSGNAFAVPGGAYAILGDSHLPETLHRVMNYMNMKHIDRFNLVFIDGDHTEEGVEDDWWDYGGLGDVVAFHDICVHAPATGCEVHKFWERRKIAMRDLSLSFCQFMVAPYTWGGIGVVGVNVDLSLSPTLM